MSLDQRFATFKTVEPPDLWAQVERRAGSPADIDMPVDLGRRRWSRTVAASAAAVLVAAAFVWAFMGLTPIGETQKTAPAGGGPPSWVIAQAMRIAAANNDPNPISADWILADADVIAPVVGANPDLVSGPEYLVVLHGLFVDRLAPGPPGAPAPRGTVLAFTLDPTTHQVRDLGLSDTPVELDGLQPLALPTNESLSPSPVP